MDFGTFGNAVQFMDSFMNLERADGTYNSRTYRLDRVAAMMEILGNPQDSMQIIHIAGSKGKGSTAAFIAKAIDALGIRTGLFMSPHVRDYRERFTIAGRFVDDNMLVSTANFLADKLGDYTFCGTRPTTFELYTAFAFLLFRNLDCRWAVIETGLGGRLDATNIVKPRACVFTPIELEHTQILGGTLEKIATEKSKIIKDGVPVFSSAQPEQAMQVLRARAQECNSRFTALPDILMSLEAGCIGEKENVKLSFRDGFEANLLLSMSGRAQAYNCALALTVLRSLGLYRKNVTEQALEGTSVAGRLERIDAERKFYIDGAHTKMSIGLLMESWKDMHGTDTGVCIFGCVQGKDYSLMEPLVLDTFEKIVVSRPGSFKPSDPAGLYEHFMGLARNTPAGVRKTIVLMDAADDAVSWAIENTNPDEPVLVCGSFYLAGEISAALERRRTCH